MSDLKLFHLSEAGVSELQGTTHPKERWLQTLFEKHLVTLLGIRFLASEHRITDGRIDTLGLDENNCPVIVEYKRNTNENVINQGLFYLDWLMDHRRDFQWLVMDRYGKEVADKVDWSAPRLICVAGDFNRYDEHAVKQMGRNIDLVRYRRFGEDLLLLDLVTAVTSTAAAKTNPDEPITGEAAPSEIKAVPSLTKYKTISEYLQDADQPLADLFEATRSALTALGEDVQERTLAKYFAFTRLKNFACVEVKPTARKLLVYIKVDPVTIELQPGFTRDVTNIGHFGTGDLEVTLTKPEDLDRALPLFERSYEAS